MGQLVDQAAHAALTAVTLAPALFAPPLVGAPASAALYMLAREWEQAREKVRDGRRIQRARRRPAEGGGAWKAQDTQDVPAPSLLDREVLDSLASGRRALDLLGGVIGGLVVGGLACLVQS